jgi:hypothetical protein
VTVGKPGSRPVTEAVSLSGWPATGAAGDAVTLVAVTVRGGSPWVSTAPMSMVLPWTRT